MASKTFACISAGDGIRVVEYDHGTGASSSFLLQAITASGLNDHDIGSLWERPDGKILAVYSTHNDPMSARISTNAGDISAWGSATLVQSGSCTYPRLQYLSSTDTLYLIYRRTTGTAREQFMRTSTDNGDTWTAEVQITGTTTQRPYMRFTSNGVDRIDFFFTDDHPNEVVGNSLYHCYYDGSTWRTSDGTSMGSPTFIPGTDMTEVYDGSSVECWIWDAAYIGGQPCALYPTFVSTSDHRYNFARYNGTTWDTVQVATAGNKIYEGSGEDQYTAGGCFGPTSTDLYLCREISTGRWEMERWQTVNNGDTWSFDTAITSNSNPAPSKVYRPYRVEGGGPFQVLYMSGPYYTYANFTSKLYGYRP